MTDRPVHLLRAADLKPQPWKNGGGVTREIAAFPPGAGLEAFDWRISAADVAADGPFSRFPGIERVLLVTGGAGMDLAFEGGATVALTADSEPLRFSGEAPVAAVLTDGPLSDLNVMTRQGRWRAEVRRRVLDTSATTAAGEVVFVVALAPTQVRDGARMEPGDALRLDAGEVVVLDPGARVAEIVLNPV